VLAPSPRLCPCKGKALAHLFCRATGLSWAECPPPSGAMRADD
jgi:hypothetical protein